MREKLHKDLKFGLIVIICGVIFGYTFFEARYLISGPELTISSPKNNAVVKDSLLEIKGQVKNINNLTIDGRQVMITPDRSFTDKLLLLNGYNTIEVKVTNKFGQVNSRILNVILAQ